MTMVLMRLSHLKLFMQAETEDTILSAIQSALTRIIRSMCECDFEETFINEPVLLCEPLEPTTFLYRASMETFEEFAASQLIVYIEDWVEQGASISFNDSVIIFSSNCPIRISNITDPVCSTATQPKPSLARVIEILIQSVSAVVIVITMIAFTILIAFCCFKERQKQ